MSRLSKNNYFIKIAELVAKRSTCKRRSVGAVLVNSHSHILATGYNGVPRGMDHCIENPCPGANLPSGQGLDLCQAIHAEQNALLQCKNVDEIEAIYTTTFPCMHCLKLLTNTSCKLIYFKEPYGDIHTGWRFWELSGKDRWARRLLEVTDISQIYYKEMGKEEAQKRCLTNFTQYQI